MTCQSRPVAFESELVHHQEAPIRIKASNEHHHNQRIPSAPCVSGASYPHAPDTSPVRGAHTLRARRRIAFSAVVTVIDEIRHLAIEAYHTILQWPLA